MDGHVDLFVCVLHVYLCVCALYPWCMCGCLCVSLCLLCVYVRVYVVFDSLRELA